MKKFAIGIGFLMFFISDIVFAQGEIDEQSKIFYQNERTFAILLNSNGFGGNYRFAKRMTDLRKTIYDFDLVGIKHPREAKISTDYSYFNRIVYGKLNEFFDIRAGIGLQNELYRKIDKGGISIRTYYSLGLSLGITKPIYYKKEFYSTNVLIPDSTITAKFSKENHTQENISKKASFFRGIDEIALIPGIHTKMGVMFEFGKSVNIIHALDLGIVVDAFIKKVEIMATKDNHQIFLSLFVSYRFGKVIDAQFKPKKNKVDEILTN